MSEQFSHIDDARFELLTNQPELAHLSDAEALERIGELRRKARRAHEMKRTYTASALLREATLIAGSHYIGMDVISEYASFLELHGKNEEADNYRRLFEELTEMLDDCGGPFTSYEQRVKEEQMPLTTQVDMQLFQDGLDQGRSTGSCREDVASDLDQRPGRRQRPRWRSQT